MPQKKISKREAIRQLNGRFVQVANGNIYQVIDGRYGAWGMSDLALSQVRGFLENSRADREFPVLPKHQDWPKGV